MIWPIEFSSKPAGHSILAVWGPFLQWDVRDTTNGFNAGGRPLGTRLAPVMFPAGGEPESGTPGAILEFPIRSRKGEIDVMVNTQVLQGRWNQVRGQLKKKWGQLTEDDLKFSSGNIDQLVGRIQHRTGEAREAIESFLDELTAEGSSAISQAAESVRNYAGQATDQVRDGYNRISEQFGRRYETSQEMIRENPAAHCCHSILRGRLTWGRRRLGIVPPLSRRSPPTLRGSGADRLETRGGPCRLL